MEISLQNSGSKLWNRMTAWPWFPFVLLGCIYFIFHLFISPDMGDDVYYLNVFSAAGFDPVSFSVARYLTWSSRTLIEGAMLAAILMPPILWKLIDTLLIVVIAVFLSKLLLRDENRRQGNVVIATLMLMLPFYIMNSAGWIATTLNYLWPLALGLVALYPLRKIADGEKLRGYEYVIYTACLLFAANQEQMCAVLVAVYAVFVIRMVAKKKCSAYMIVQLMLCILSLVYILACPGNGDREAAEATKWYPEFLSLTLPEKIRLGFLAGFKDLFLMQYLPVFAFALVLCMLVWKKRRQAVARLVALIPPIGVCAMFALRPFAEPECPALYDLFYLNNWFDAGAAMPLLMGMIVTAAALFASVWLLYGKGGKAFFMAGILVLGFASKAAVCLSPTVWASGQRTALFMVVAFIAATVLLLNEWDFKNRKWTRILFALSVLGAVCGIVSNSYVAIIL